ncbi:MAG: hypothetical protein ABSG32_08945 [Terriglobia bacterium]|jgi:LPXTG-motif cell wall-anchored protein
MRVRQVSLLVSLVALVLMGAQPGKAEKEGHLVIHVTPNIAYVYADGEPVVESYGHFIRLSPGEHRIDLYNYGYKPETRTVTILSHKTAHLKVTMEAVPGVVTGPWGCITIEGNHHAAVLLNGKDPEEFFVGNLREFNHEFFWKRELIVPPGHHELTVEYDHGDPWSTGVDVQANQRVVVDAHKGVRKTEPWPRGDQLKELARFRGGEFNDHVAVEKVNGLFSSSTGQVKCGESAHLTWSSTGATKVELNGAPVSASGDQTVQPKQNTDYKFTAAGPGGVYTSDATVNVNPDIHASLSVTPADVNIQNNSQGTRPQSTATVTWSAPNADSVTIDPLGSVGANGSQEVPVAPSSSSPGPIDQTVTYTLHASNACGESETRTATLHLTGSNGVLQGTAAPPEEPPAEAPQVAAAAPEQLPQTASQWPLLGLIGILLLAVAASFHLILKKLA